jgi:hypothetical protein
MIIGLCVFLLTLVYCSEALGATIKVPADSPTIQGAIAIATDGDTILVAPGTYHETINYQGKAITIVSEAGPATTIIDGNQAGTVVIFNASEGRGSVLDGFTIQNGKGLNGGGLYIRLSSPTIRRNIITNNFGEEGGGGIMMIANASPLIESNTISRNQGSCCGPSGGGGIYIGGGGDSALILNNLITENTTIAGNGGGISINGSGTTTIRGNIITNNVGFSVGGGIAMINHCDAIIVDNLIAGNAAATSVGTNVGGYGNGGGIYALPPNDFSRPRIYNNTIVNNDGVLSSGVYLEGFKAQTEIINNIIVAKTGQFAVVMDNTYTPSHPVFRFNDVFSRKAPAYHGDVPDQTGLNANISADPLFVNEIAGDFHLAPGTPCLDSGQNGLAVISDADVEGNPRVVDGKGSGNAVVDLGAYEKQNPRIVTVSIDGKNLVLLGDHFDGGSVILVNGAAQRTIHDSDNPATLLIGKKLRKLFSPGQNVDLKVRDSDGGLSPDFPYVFPLIGVLDFTAK